MDSLGKIESRHKKEKKGKEIKQIPLLRDLRVRGETKFRYNRGCKKHPQSPLKGAIIK
jgi:hypothetical protein